MGSTAKQHDTRYKLVDGMAVPAYCNHSGIIANHAARFPKFLQHIPEDRRDLAIDVGAHVGFWTRRMAAVFSRVVAYEADRINYDALVMNTEDLTNVESYKKAVSSEPGVDVRTYRNQRAREDNSGARHCAVSGVQGDGLVKTVQLDQAAWPGDRVDLIKIDVEGMELDVLKGGKALIGDHFPYIILERSTCAGDNYGADDWAATNFLLNWGYSIIASDGRDFLFAPGGGDV